MSDTAFLNAKSKSEEGAEWVSLSDLMTSLMLVFLLLAVSFMVTVESDKKKIENIAHAYTESKSQIYEDLKKEFEKDLPRWGATLDKNLVVRFQEPDILFNVGRYRVNRKFKNILKDFFPRYINILMQEKYNGLIQEVRIEGHTSTFWNKNSTFKEAYFKNMELSQARTRSTLEYVMSLKKLKSKVKWLVAHVTANGLSSSKPILLKNGQEDQKVSQRVEFRVVTDSEKKIDEILEIKQ